MRSAFVLGLRAAALAISLAACAGPTPARTPVYCSAIGIQESESRALLDLIQRFARAEHLSGGAGIVASAYQDDRRTVELGVTTSLGPIGATIDVYALKQNYDRSLVAKLRAYVERDIGSRWQVRDCRDVPGMDLPRRIGQ